LALVASSAESKFPSNDVKHPATRGEPWWFPTRHPHQTVLHRRIGRVQTRRDRIGFWNPTRTPS